MYEANTTVVGFDVSDGCTYAFRTARDNPEAGERDKIPTRKLALVAYLVSLPRGSTVVLEVGPHSRWIFRLVVAAGHHAIVANARRLRFIYAGTSKTDRLDAEALARVACLQPALLYPIRHRSEQAQRDLGVLQGRDTLVTVRTKLINTLRSLVKASGMEPLASCDAERFLERHGQALLDLDLAHFSAMVRSLKRIQTEIEILDNRLVRIAKTYPVIRVLQQVAGIGPITALAFVLVIEDPDRFHSSRKVGAYLGLVPRLDQSGNSDPKLGITKAGHPLLRRLLVQAAFSTMRTNARDSALKRHGQRIRAKGDKGAAKRAAIAVARKLAVVLLTLWKTGEVYEPLRNAA